MTFEKNELRFIKIGSEILNPFINCENTKPVFIFDVDGTLYDDKNEDYKNFYKFACEKYGKKLGITGEEFHFSMKNSLANGQHHFTKFFSDNNLKKKGSFIHLRNFDADMAGFVKPNPELWKILQFVPKPRICFTNSNEYHCRNTLKAIKLDDCFDYAFVCNFYDDHFSYKPQEKAFSFVNCCFSKPPNRIIFFDDNIKNVTVANSFGWKSIFTNYFELIDDIKLFL